MTHNEKVIDLEVNTDFRNSFHNQRKISNTRLQYNYLAQTTRITPLMPVRRFSLNPHFYLSHAQVCRKIFFYFPSLLSN